MVAAAALAYQAGGVAEASDASATSDSPTAGEGRPGVQGGAARIRRSSRAQRHVRVIHQPAPSLAAPGGQTNAAGEPSSQSELRDWIKENATLLSNASLLISIAALAINFLPQAGLLNPYIQALIFGAAFLLLIELHHQWPDDLQIHVFGRQGSTRHHSWRMTAFALLFQIATVLFAVWATLTNPLILLPLTAFAVIIAFRTWYFRHHQGLLARIVGIVALVVVLLISELLMGIVWSLATNQPITIEIWTDELPGAEFTVD